jgi:toxin ParE1/3/4
MRVVFTAAALSDLDAIADWIGRDSLSAAEAFVLRLRDRCHSLAKHPNGYPAVDILPFRDLRKLTHRGYLIFYRSRAAEVEIVHILQGSRDWEASFRAKPVPSSDATNSCLRHCERSEAIQRACHQAAASAFGKQRGC